MKEVPREELATLSPEEMMQRLVQTGDAMLTFRNGKYPVSAYDYVPITGISISRESVLIRVSGISQVAEVVAKEVIEAVSASAGAMKPWAELEGSIQRKGYGTRTRVQLGDLDNLLSPNLRAFIADRMLKGEKYAASMGYSLLRDDFGPPPNAICMAAFDDLTIRFSRFDPENGESYASTLEFHVVATSEYGQGIVSIGTELPYEEHIAVVGQLIRALATGGK